MNAPKIKERDLATFIEAAIDKLKQHGWVRGTLGTRRAGFCVMGAFQEVYAEAVRRGVDRQVAVNTYGHATNLVAAQVGGHIPAFNDSQERAEPVLRVLEDTVKNLRTGKSKVPVGHPRVSTSNYPLTEQSPAWP